jgi:amidase
MPGIEGMLSIVLQANLYFSDGGKQECDAIEGSGEPYRPLTDYIIKENPHVEEHTATSLWAASARRNEYRAEYAEHWNKTATGLGPNGEPVGAVDVILCPATPSAAPKLDTSKYWGYTAQWNLLDYPAAIFPVGQVQVEKDDVKEAYEPRNEQDKYNWSLWEQYGAEGWKDAPISLQLVGRRYDDEKVIRALEVIKEIAEI